MIYDLALKYDTGKELLEFYVTKYDKILKASEFVKLPPIYQIGIIFEFLQVKKNIGMLVDLHNVNIFYVDPRINANNLIKHLNILSFYLLIYMRYYQQNNYFCQYKNLVL
jgi:hypothetical protein